MVQKKLHHRSMTQLFLTEREGVALPGLQAGNDQPDDVR